jgi:mRNA-binding protein PUF3
MPQALSGPSQYYTHLPPLSIQVPAVSGVPLPAGTPNAYRIAQEQSLDPVLREYLRLEKSHKSHEKARAEAYRIADIVGHVVMFCVENSGSRLVQALIEGGNCDVREQVLQEVHSNLLQLSKDAYGNYVIQKLLQYCTQPQKIIIWNALKGNVASLSCNKHACRVVQDVSFLLRKYLLQLVTDG